MRTHLFILPAFVLLLAACTPAQETATDLILDWDVTEQQPGAFDEPHFSLSLTMSGAMQSRVDVGNYSGSFADGRGLANIDASGALLTGMSWWAGAGDEFRVEQTSPTMLTISHRGVEEESQPGAFSTLKTVEIPANVSIELAPSKASN